MKENKMTANCKCGEKSLKVSLLVNVWLTCGGQCILLCVCVRVLCEWWWHMLLCDFSLVGGSAAVWSFIQQSDCNAVLTVRRGKRVWQPPRTLQLTDLCWDSHRLTYYAADTHTPRCMRKRTHILPEGLSQFPREAAGFGFIASIDRSWGWVGGSIWNPVTQKRGHINPLTMHACVSDGGWRQKRALPRVYLNEGGHTSAYWSLLSLPDPLLDTSLPAYIYICTIIDIFCLTGSTSFSHYFSGNQRWGTWAKACNNCLFLNATYWPYIIIRAC